MQILARLACQLALLAATFVDAAHRDAVHTAVGAHDVGADHVVKVDKRVNGVFAPQVAHKTPDAVRAFVALLDVDSYNREVLGRVDKQRRCNGLCGDDKPHRGVCLAGGVDHRDGHRDITEGGKSRYEYVFVFFCQFYLPGFDYFFWA